MSSSSGAGRIRARATLLPVVALLPVIATAQDAATEQQIEEIVVTGTYIPGLSEETLPVTIMNDETIKNLGAVNMQDVLAYIPSIGDFEFEDTNTGTNGARGDVAGVNMRGLGSGNTLVLLNGRRMVAHPTFQAINNVPVTFYNVNSIPTPSIRRIEVLRDGASAIYGADASAGAINFIPYTDLEGARVSGKYGASSEHNYDETEFTARGGLSFNDGRTSLGLFGTYYERSPVNMHELPELYFNLARQGNEALPEEWRDDTQLTNTSGLTPYAKFETGTLTPEGSWISTGTLHVDPATGQLLPGSGSDRYNFNEDQYVTPETDRISLLATLNHDFGNDLGFFGDLSYYDSTSNTLRAASPFDDSLAFLVVPDDQFHNTTGEQLLITAWRPIDLGPRLIEVNQETYRLLGGLRGKIGTWDWESAAVWSEAESTDWEGNRQAKSTFTNQLGVSGPDALNPFVGPGGNSEATWDGVRVSATDVRTSRLGLWDLRLNKADLFSMPGGDVGLATGIEWRYEYYKDDRDPRLDGSMPFENPPISDESDLIGVSATFDSSGSRDTVSAYGEVFLPFVSDANAVAFTKALEMQLAVRYENTSDFGDTTKPKISLRWEPISGFSLRGSYAEGFRAPNLPQLNQGTLVRRILGIEDPLREGVTGFPVDTGDTYRRTTRVANENLEPEDTETTMYGFVIAPKIGPLSGLRITWDWWNIKQEGVVGILEPEDALDLDALLRSMGSSNPDVIRAAVTPADQAAFDAWNAANPGDQRTPVGEATNIINQYINLDPRETEGWDASVQYATPEFGAGQFTFRYDATKITKFEQQGLAVEDLVRRNGNPETRSTLGVTWDFRDFSANLTMRYVGEVYDTSLWAPGSDVSGIYDPVLDRTYWEVDSWTVYDLGLTYDFYNRSGWSKGLVLSAGVRNLTDEEPPFADESFGFFSHLHNYYGRVVWGQLTYAF